MLSVENTLTPDRTSEGFYHITGGLDMAINRGVQYAPYADLLWMETSTPDLDEAKEFAKRIHEKFPGKWLAYNCSPSFNWGKKFSMKECENFQGELGDLIYLNRIRLVVWVLIAIFKIWNLMIKLVDILQLNTRGK
jgi:isocitrate lyase